MHCRGVKTHGFWKNHYTMTLWDSEEDMNDFYRSGAHLEAIKDARRMSSEIVLLRLEADGFPAWSEVKPLLWQEGRKYRFDKS